jgi:hypothetical protein
VFEPQLANGPGSPGVSTVRLAAVDRTSQGGQFPVGLRPIHVLQPIPPELHRRIRQNRLLVVAAVGA